MQQYTDAEGKPRSALNVVQRMHPSLIVFFRLNVLTMPLIEKLEVLSPRKPKE